MGIGSIKDHRGREKGILVYPVYSRRSQGLSVGINLFPDCKICSFDCPYCEVFPFNTKTNFSIQELEENLKEELLQIKTVVKDICFSGNGEPTMSPYFLSALESVSIIRNNFAPESDLVLITNGSTLLNQDIFNALSVFANGKEKLTIWLKLDAGTEDWYNKINRSQISYENLMNKIKDFVEIAPVTIQTMICKVKGSVSPQEEILAWEKLVTELSQTGNIQAIHIYGKARPAFEDPLAEMLPSSYLEERSFSLKKALQSADANTKVEVFP